MSSVFQSRTGESYDRYGGFKNDGNSEIIKHTIYMKARENERERGRQRRKEITRIFRDLINEGEVALEI